MKNLNHNQQNKQNLENAHRELKRAQQTAKLDAQFGFMGFILTQDQIALSEAKQKVTTARIAFYIG